MYNLMNIFHISTATFTEGGPSFQIKIQVMGFKKILLSISKGN